MCWSRRTNLYAGIWQAVHASFPYINPSSFPWFLHTIALAKLSISRISCLHNMINLLPNTGTSHSNPKPEHCKSLLDLPPETTLEITSYLPQSDVQALRSTCRHLDILLIDTFGKHLFCEARTNTSRERTLASRLSQSKYRLPNGSSRTRLQYLLILRRFLMSFLDKCDGICSTSSTARACHNSLLFGERAASQLVEARDFNFEGSKVEVVSVRTRCKKIDDKATMEEMALANKLDKVEPYA